MSGQYIDILEKLNRGLGVRGSMVVTDDGIVVQSLLGKDLEEERVAAMSSSVIQTTQRALQAVGLPRFISYILTAAHGKMVFFDVSKAFLVVLTEKNVNIDLTLIEMRAASQKIKALGHIEIDD